MVTRETIGLVAAVVGILNYVPYVWSILKGQMRPHAFSWLVWGVLTTIAFAAQLVSNGGAGTWVTGITALGCFMIFALALFKGQKTFPAADWAALIGAFVAMILWWLTNNPLGAVIMVCIVDLLGSLPTFRKGFVKPFEDSTLMFSVASLKFIIGLFALDAFTFVTAAYPILVIILNGGFVILLWIRRSQLGYARTMPL